jgi:hypothetical protein
VTQDGVGVDWVTVRPRWNASLTLPISLSSLHAWQFRDEAGGVCRASPRAFLHAHAWCDQVDGAALGHRCGADPPHELLVCVLPIDNIVELYSRLAALGRGRRAR